MPKPKLDSTTKKEPGRRTASTDNAEHKRELLDILAGELPPVIARKDVERFLGGIVTRKTLANADARGDGPETTYAVGRNVVYRREALLEWLSRSFSIQRLVSKPFSEAEDCVRHHVSHRGSNGHSASSY
jgi:hypothetical protein